ncbi:MAG: hypothetical protein DRQ13_01745 [Ignavibacteriae bacterium]|nr:MAG: hypothetical protein DRQ13_01745 [Ignavibacteriota bacterium]
MRKIFISVLFLMLVSSSALGQSGYGTDVTGVFAIPIGKEANLYNPGFGALAGFYYDIEENVRLALVLGYIRMGLNNSELNKKLAGNNNGSADINGSVNTFPILASFRLVTPGPKMRFYGLIEAGIYTYWNKAEGTYFPGDGEVPIDESEFRSEVGMAFGGGVLFPLNDELNFDFNVRYHFVRDSEYLNIENTVAATTSQMLTIGLGVSWFFPLE